jgi:hypothetical protein
MRMGEAPVFDGEESSGRLGLGSYSPNGGPSNSEGEPLRQLLMMQEGTAMGVKDIVGTERTAAMITEEFAPVFNH